jgi:hypothetical protein
MIMGIAEIVLGVLLGLGIMRGRGSSSVFARIFGGGILIAMGVVFVMVPNAGEIIIGEGSVYFKIPFQRDKLVRSGEIVSVTEVDYTADRDYRPVRKISGGNIKDVKTGWYRLANGKKAFLCLEGTRGLYVETTLGFPVLAGAHQFEAFEAAFAEHVYRLPAVP